ncbi:MAG: hypothetical protein ACKO04_16930 [Actinomycetes bacterium]
MPTAAGWVWARVCVAAGFVVAHLLSGSVRLPDGRLHLDEGLMTWDGTYYRVLASGGYGAGVEGAGRFFPLYPTLGRVLEPVLGGRTDLALLLVTNLAAFAAGLVVWQLTREVCRNERDADRSAWVLALWPAAFVLVFAYAESLFVLAVAGTLLMLHRRSFGLAGLLALVAALVRPVGLLLVVPAVVEVALAWTGRPERPGPRNEDDHRPPPKVAGSLLAVLGAPVGTLLALTWISAASGDAWSAPLDVQRQLRAGFHEPVTRLVRALLDVGTGDLRDVVNLAFAVVGIGLLVISFRRRQPWAWQAYSLVTVLVVLSANNIDSLGRYLMAAVPLLVVLAQWADRPWRVRTVAVLGSAGLVAGTAAALLGRIVP